MYVVLQTVWNYLCTMHAQMRLLCAYTDLSCVCPACSCWWCRRPSVDRPTAASAHRPSIDSKIDENPNENEPMMNFERLLSFWNSLCRNFETQKFRPVINNPRWLIFSDAYELLHDLRANVGRQAKRTIRFVRELIEHGHLKDKMSYSISLTQTRNERSQISARIYEKSRSFSWSLISIKFSVRSIPMLRCFEHENFSHQLINVQPTDIDFLILAQVVALFHA